MFKGCEKETFWKTCEVMCAQLRWQQALLLHARSSGALLALRQLMELNGRRGAAIAASSKASRQVAKVLREPVLREAYHERPICAVSHLVESKTYSKSLISHLPMLFAS